MLINIPAGKNAFHYALIQNDLDFLAHKTEGTKAAPLYILDVAGGASTVVHLRLTTKQLQQPFDDAFTACFDQRKKEADIFYKGLIKENESSQHAAVRRQALAGMLWSKQFYYYDVATWLQGDAMQPVPPQQRWNGRNANWMNFKAADIISMPDKWEYPWFAAWDLAFHTIAIAGVDSNFAKKQLLLLFGENYIAADGQLPAYEWNFSDVNPPVQALAALEICRIDKERFGKADLSFLQTIFPLLLKNYNWWLSREDANNNNVFEGGFLGLDNISVFDRSHGLPEGGRLDQADGTAWMALFSLNMLEIALQLCAIDKKYEDDCLTFFDHFVQIAGSLQQIAKVWADTDAYDDGFFYDVLQLPDGRSIPVKLRSIAGIIPLFAVLCISKEQLKYAPRLKKLLYNFENGNERYQIVDDVPEKGVTLLSLLTPAQLKSLLPVLFSEHEMLSAGGIRSVSKVYEEGFLFEVDGTDYGLKYMPGESDTGMYGGNSNWRGPVWMPLNYLIVRSLKIFAGFYKNEISFYFSGIPITLADGANELSNRLINMFIPAEDGNRPIHGSSNIYQTKYFEDLILFYEHFHGETSHGIGASHQTGWTGLAALL
ncbi:MGH1-like glycoside hydrolase domain-containing protein [Ferruginibacter sp.]